MARLQREGLGNIGRRMASVAVRLVAALLLALLPAAAQGQSADGAGGAGANGAVGAGASRPVVPVYRRADRVAVIPIRGPIDNVMELSVKRRIKQAEASGAQAMVIEVDSPGGEVGAVLEISNAIKGSTITNTVAWVHDDAYSGGAIAALACRELVTSSPASMGDAFPVTISPQGVRGLTQDQRQKILPPLLSDVADSARRNGHDEYLVQAMVVDGIELWAVRDTKTSQMVCINEAEFRLLFDGEPPRGKPLLTGVPRGRAGPGTGGAASDPSASGESGPPDSESATPDGATADGTGPDADGPDGAGSGGAGPDGGAAPKPAPASGGSLLAEATPEAQRFKPAADSLSDVAAAVTDGLAVESQRPVITAADRGRYVDPVYMCDGTGPVVLRDPELRLVQMSRGIVQNDEELRAYFDATDVRRTEMNWSEQMVRFLLNPLVRGVLIVLLVLGVFLEMLSPGAVVPATVALAAVALLLGPPMLIGLAGWWEILAIVLGIVLLAAEAFVIPGFGLAGVAGLVLLFAGLVGTFIPDGSGGLFGTAAGRSGALFGVVTVLLAMFTSGIAMWLIAKNFGTLPILRRMVLAQGGSAGQEAASALGEVAGSEEASVLTAAFAPEDALSRALGQRGTAISALRPSGRVALESGEVHDAISSRGVIDAGRGVRVVGREGFSVVVEPAPAGHGPARANAEGERA